MVTQYCHGTPNPMYPYPSYGPLGMLINTFNIKEKYPVSTSCGEHFSFMGIPQLGKSPRKCPKHSGKYFHDNIQESKSELKSSAWRRIIRFYNMLNLLHMYANVTGMCFNYYRPLGKQFYPLAFFSLNIKSNCSSMFHL